MKKGNVVDLQAYRRSHKDENSSNKFTISKELRLAIRRLIQRMRKQGPMRRSKRA